MQIARGQKLPWPLTDAARADIAAWIFRTHRPNFMLLHLRPPTPPSTIAVRARRKRWRRWRPQTGMSRPCSMRWTRPGFRRYQRRHRLRSRFRCGRSAAELNTLFKAEGWLQVDDLGRVMQWEVLSGVGRIRLRLPQEPRRSQDSQACAGDLDAVASDPANGVERVFSTEDLRAVGADPRASFAVDMRSGFYAGGGSSALIVQAMGRGGHGNDPSRPDLHASLIMAGPLVPRAGGPGVVRMTQIAPTIAAWFGVHLSRKADEPLALTPVPRH